MTYLQIVYWLIKLNFKAYKEQVVGLNAGTLTQRYQVCRLFFSCHSWWRWQVGKLLARLDIDDVDVDLECLYSWLKKGFNKHYLPDSPYSPLPSRLLSPPPLIDAARRTKREWASSIKAF